MFISELNAITPQRLKRMEFISMQVYMRPNHTATEEEMRLFERLAIWIYPDAKENRNVKTTTMRVFNRYKGDDEGAIVIGTDLHCPGCGRQNVFVEEGEGDYYTGPTHYCNTCDYTFTLPSGGVNENLKWDEAKDSEPPHGDKKTK